MTHKLHISDTLSLDLLKLVDSRMLITANSGGGKSYLMRVVAEQAAGNVQTIILDPEGEFSTLREKFDFLLVGESGEIPCETRSAALLARKLLELEASAVVDMSGLPLAERRRFVRLFLESLITLPKTLWRPLIVMLDEAHLFCPERSAGEAESTQAVINLMSLGRKRSYCGILATQRLSKLHKDAEAETNNVFIGRTWLDLDQARAGKLLGIQKKDELQLRDLPPGTFQAFGPALSKDGVNEIVARQSETTHPKAGQRHKLVPPKPSEAVKRITADLADLPQQAEAEIRGLDDAKKKIRELEQQLRARPVEHIPEVKIERVEIPVLKNGLLEKASGVMDRMAKLQDQLAGVLSPVKEAFDKVAAAPAPTAPIRKPAPMPIARPPATPRPAIEASPAGVTSVSPERKQRFLDAAATLQTLNVEVSRETVSAWVGVHPRGGSVGEVLKSLQDDGYFFVDRGRIVVTDLGMQHAVQLDPHQAIESAKAGLGKRQRQFFEFIMAAYPNEVTREEIAENFQLHPRGGSLGEDLGSLVGRGLVDGHRGRYRARDFLFATV